jgi:hypothetical protein
MTAGIISTTISTFTHGPGGVDAGLLSFVDTRFLPVLVADYLAAHLLVYGVIALAVMRWRGIRSGHVAWFGSRSCGIRDLRFRRSA